LVLFRTVTRHLTGGNNERKNIMLRKLSKLNKVCTINCEGDIAVSNDVLTVIQFATSTLESGTYTTKGLNPVDESLVPPSVPKTSDVKLLPMGIREIKASFSHTGDKYPHICLTSDALLSTDLISATSVRIPPVSVDKPIIIHKSVVQFLTVDTTVYLDAKGDRLLFVRDGLMILMKIDGSAKFPIAIMNEIFGQARSSMFKLSKEDVEMVTREGQVITKGAVDDLTPLKPILGSYRLDNLRKCLASFPNGCDMRQDRREPNTLLITDGSTSTVLAGAIT